MSSVPPAEAFTSFEYVYRVNATDPDGDTITYSLAAFPEGMVIDYIDGTVRWRPLQSQTGNHTVRLVVSDGSSSFIQEFTIRVVRAANFPLPVVRVSSPAEGASVNRSAFIAGSAWSAPEAPAVSLVELRVDSGEWTQASLTGDAWSCSLDTSRYRNGAHTVTVRAFDGLAYSQEVLVNLTFDNPKWVLLDYDVRTDPDPTLALSGAALLTILGPSLIVVVERVRGRRGAGAE
ncbi:MAG: putative Ig domain-containing protein [Thermoplasmatota archaeon]